MFNRKVLWLAIGAALLAGAPSVLAEQTSVTAEYSMELEGNCTISATGQIFGTQPYDRTTHVTGEAAGSVTVTCPNGTNYDWGINGGLHWEAGSYLYYRHLEGPGPDYVPYELMYDPTHGLGDRGLELIDPSYTPVSAPSGLDSAVQIGGALVGNGGAQTYNLTANIYLNIDTPHAPGTYSDTVTVTVVW